MSLLSEYERPLKLLCKEVGYAETKSRLLSETSSAWQFSSQPAAPTSELGFSAACSSMTSSFSSPLSVSS